MSFVDFLLVGGLVSFDEVPDKNRFTLGLALLRASFLEEIPAPMYLGLSAGSEVAYVFAPALQSLLILLASALQMACSLFEVSISIHPQSGGWSYC